MNYQTNSAYETLQLAKKLSKKLSSRIILLEGDLGSGKTTFVQGFAQGLGVKKLGLKEILSNDNNIVLIEWAEKLKELPEGAIIISIKKEGKSKRVFTIAS